MALEVALVVGVAEGRPAREVAYSQVPHHLRKHAAEITRARHVTALRGSGERGVGGGWIKKDGEKKRGGTKKKQVVV